MRRLSWVPLVAIVAVVGMLVIPLPAFFLSFLIIVNLAGSLTILFVAMRSQEALQFSAFPSLLLITTLFRLALNVSSTRLILTQGFAGSVIQTFGSIVIGSNAVVGMIVFIILSIIQYIVITRGSERVAEVAARFTLDAMPGKQISIDADLNSGMITESEARSRRQTVEREADFYGAMDGASRFVRGDAIASMIIVAINVIGGFIIGVAMRGDSFSSALSTYTVLSVGDGLVSQIPALLLSTATGIIVTRSAASDDFGTEIVRQVFAYPSLLYLVAGLIALLGVFTPITPLPTFPLSLILVFAGRRMNRVRLVSEAQARHKEEQDQSRSTKSPESMFGLIQIEPVEFEFGYGLVPLADAGQGGDLLERVALIRRQIALDLGIVVPMIRFRDDIGLGANEYVIRIRSNEVARYELMPGHFLAMSPGTADSSIIGVETKEPAFGLPAEWIGANMRDAATLSGYTVVDAPSLIATHLTEVLKRHAHELLGRQETRALLDAVKEKHPVLVEELIPQALSVGDVQKVLQSLLRERISVRDLPTILEALSDQAHFVKDPDLLTEHARQRLARQITAQVRGVAPSITAITLSSATERRLSEHLMQTEHGTQMALDPRLAQQLLKAVNDHMARLASHGKSAILLVSPAMRTHVRRIMARALPDLFVLSYSELDPDAPIESGGVVNV